MTVMTGLERKFCTFENGVTAVEGCVIEGYASIFEARDQGGDTVAPGAYAASLARHAAAGRRVKMLWQHDPAQPIGVWDEVREDAKGLYVKGRILETVGMGRDAVALLEAGALDGLSIGYRTVRASPTEGGHRRLTELDLWEVSLVTFPMLPTARVAGKADPDSAEMVEALARTLETARDRLTDSGSAGQAT